MEEWGIIQPHSRLLRAGGSVPTRIVENDGPLLDLLTVGKQGIDIKENARVAHLYKLQ